MPEAEDSYWAKIEVRSGFKKRSIKNRNTCTNTVNVQLRVDDYRDDFPVRGMVLSVKIVLFVRSATTRLQTTKGRMGALMSITQSRDNHL